MKAISLRKEIIPFIQYH